jgi:MFS transporter, SP family, sugar:H+ symporter
MEEAKSALARTRQVRADDVHTRNLLEREVEGIRETAEHERKMRAGWLACFDPQRKTLYRTLFGGLV